MGARGSITHQTIKFLKTLQQIITLNKEKKRAVKIQKKPITLVCRFLFYKNKTNIMKNAGKLKGKNIFINEDFSHESMEFEGCNRKK